MLSLHPFILKGPDILEAGLKLVTRYPLSPGWLGL